MQSVIGGKIDLGHQQPVGDRNLPDRLAMRGKGVYAVDGIDGRDHAVDPVATENIGRGHQRVQHRHGIGEPGGLDQHAVKRRDRTGSAARGEIGQRLDQILAH